MSAGSPRQKEQDDLPLLTVLRFFAATWVVLSHHYRDWNMVGEGWMGVVQGVLGHGEKGVKVFFILSGFILTHVYARLPKVGLRSFYVARFARVFPLHLFALGLALPSLVLIQYNLEFVPMGFPAAWLQFSVRSLSVVCLLQAWIPEWAHHWNGVSWSLSAELFFYLMFPLLLSRIRDVSWRSLLWCFAVCTICVVARDFANAERPDLSSFLRFNPLLQFPDFVSGVVVGLTYRKGVKIPVWTSFLLAFAFLFTVGTRFLPVVLESLSIHVIGCAFILSLAMPIRLESIPGRVCLLLGQASFATYLIHQPVSYLCDRITSRLFGCSIPYLAYYALLIGASILLFSWVETPARRWIRNRLG
jgi:peptidoglycan/LPS O-acetylase OafA/YrhL